MEKRRCKAKSFWEFKINRLLDSKGSNPRFDFGNLFLSISKSKRSTSSLKQGYYNKITPCSKSSQTTIFIILAVLIVAVIILFFYMKGELNFGETINPDVQPIYSYVENCVEETGENGIYHIGQTGGYFYPPDITTEGGSAIYFDRGNNYMPSKEKIEEELSEYMKNLIGYCINNFEDFPDFEISESEINTKTEIKDDKVVFDVIYPLSIKKGDKSYSIKKFSGEVFSKLGIVYDTAFEIIQEQLEHPKDICMTCIDDLAVEKDLYVEMLDYDEETILFIIRDKNSQLLDEDFKFVFVNKYEAE